MATAEPDSAQERNPLARNSARAKIAGRLTDSGIEVKPVYTADDLPPGELELPGEHPFTRGPYRTMYRGRPWTVRQYAGYGSAEETNARFRYLLSRGQTGVSVAFDLPTQLGYDSDDPLAEGEVGRTGVAIDSLADMQVLLDGIPLGEVSTSMTINAPAALLLLLYELVAEELAFTLSNGIAYCEAAVAAGLSPDEFGERLSFFFNAHNHFFQEVAKFRAARRLWARIMSERFGAT